MLKYLFRIRFDPPADRRPYYFLTVTLGRVVVHLYISPRGPRHSKEYRHVVDRHYSVPSASRARLSWLIDFLCS